MELLQTLDELQRFCDEVRSEGRFGLDMEFERERSYWAILQLVQAATRSRCVLIDPLALPHLDPLWELVADPSVEAIVHAGMQDMEIFHNLSGRLPSRLFDTQIAAALLGMGEQPGYADLVRRLLEVRLRKAERTTDWGLRPLSEAQMNYALDDVRYLHSLHDELQGRLDERNRRPWLDEEIAFYYEIETYERDPQRLWLRVARHRSLSPRGLAVLRELAAWREKEAQSRNIPRARVVQDDVLIDISRRLPSHADQLKVLRRLHPREIARSADGILAAVDRGRNCPDVKLPRLPQIRDDDPELNVTVDLLATFVKMRARESRIAASYLATKKDLAEFANAHRNGRTSGPLRLRMGWRHDLVGRELENFLDGKLALAVIPGMTRLRLVPLTANDKPS